MATPLASTQAFDVAHQLCWISEVPSTNGCEDPPSGATSFTYDIFGNRTSMTPDGGPTTSYGYDQANRLVGVTGPLTTSYGYNGDGLRVSKTVDVATTGFVWDSLNAMPVIVAEGDLYYLYGPDGLPLARIENQGAGDAVFYHLDHQGSVRALTDEDGELVATYSYDPYGNPAGSTGSIDQPLRYTGQYLDNETGLYQLRARYYDPTTGQFTTIDPLLPDTNQPYTYASNDPINTIDPEGLWGIRLGPVKIGNDGCMLGTNPDGSCRGAAVARNPVVQTAAVVGACTFAGAVGCYAANATVGTGVLVGAPTWGAHSLLDRWGC